MNAITAIFTHASGSFNDSAYYKWSFLEDLCKGHYHGIHQVRDRYVHHLAVL